MGRPLTDRACAHRRRSQRDLAGDRPGERGPCAACSVASAATSTLRPFDDAADRRTWPASGAARSGSAGHLSARLPGLPPRVVGASLDVGEALWLELQRSAERTLARRRRPGARLWLDGGRGDAAVADPACRLSAAGRWRVMGFLHHLAGMALGASRQGAARPTLPSRFAASPFAGASQGLEVIDQATPTIPALPARPEVAGSPLPLAMPPAPSEREEAASPAAARSQRPPPPAEPRAAREPVTSTGRRFATAVAFAEHRQRGRTPVTVASNPLL